MPSLNNVLFPHRTNENGSYDSICRICHLTVASARIEAELARFERSHVCDPIRIYQLSEDTRAQHKSNVGSKIMRVLRHGSSSGNRESGWPNQPSSE